MDTGRTDKKTLDTEALDISGYRARHKKGFFDPQSLNRRLFGFLAFYVIKFGKIDFLQNIILKPTKLVGFIELKR